MKFLILFLITFSASASSVYFADFCSSKEIKVGTPNGTTLMVNLKGLNPEEDLRLDIKYLPSSVDKLRADQQMLFKYIVRAENISHKGEWSGRFNLPKTRWMRAVEKELLNYRVWDAEVIWYQSNKARSAFTTFYHPLKNSSYYEIISESLCSWEGRPQVDSKLYENHKDENMRVSRSTSISIDESKETGVSFGFSQQSLGNNSIGFFSATNLGWVFQEWKNQISNSKYLTINRDYYLSKGEAGLFYVRPTFNRHKARKYSWVKKRNQCGSFEKVSQGYIDIGKTLEDFIVLPANYYGKESLIEFIEIVRPPINFCKSFRINGVTDAQDIITTGRDELIYFYEVGEHK